MTKIVNIYKDSYQIYIGRSGRGKDGDYGNPIRVGISCHICGKTHGKGETLLCYEVYLKNRLSVDEVFRESVKNLNGMVLGCFCKPKPCHGDVLIKYIQELNKV